MRRSIMVFGCTLEDNTTVNTTDEGIVSVRVHPDHSVTVTNSNNEVTGIG